nr:hypothetical protein [Prescottella equi]
MAGRSSGVALDELVWTGEEGGRAFGRTLGGGDRPFAAARCEQTVAPLAVDRGLTPRVDDRLVEVDYGQWTGRELKELVRGPALEGRPAAASAAGLPRRGRPGPVQARAVVAVREHDRRLAEEHGATCCGWPAFTAT